MNILCMHKACVLGYGQVAQSSIYGLQMCYASFKILTYIQPELWPQARKIIVCMHNSLCACTWKSKLFHPLNMVYIYSMPSLNVRASIQPKIWSQARKIIVCMHTSLCA